MNNNYRENEWLYGTKEGRKELAGQANFSRLLLVHLSRNHKYDNMQEVIKELSSKVMELAPKGLPKDFKVNS